MKRTYRGVIQRQGELKPEYLPYLVAYEKHCPPPTPARAFSERGGPTRVLGPMNMRDDARSADPQLPALVSSLQAGLRHM